MNERERWIVYPLLFFALGTALREKIGFDGAGIPQKQVFAKEIVLVNDNFEPLATLGGNKQGTAGELKLFHGLPDQLPQARYTIGFDSQGTVKLESQGALQLASRGTVQVESQGSLQLVSRGALQLLSQGQIVFQPPLHVELPGFMLFPKMQLPLLQQQQQQPATPPRAVPREPQPQQKQAPTKQPKVLNEQGQPKAESTHDAQVGELN